MKGLENKLALRRGLLGQLDYRSSDDSDYAPPEDRAAAAAAAAAARKPAAAKRTAERKDRKMRAPAAPAPAPAVGGTCHAVSSSSEDSSVPLSVRAAKRAAGAGAHQKAASSPSSWAHLPNSLLLQVFQEVCKKHALPMLPMLCLVCCDWRAAAAAAPELWRRLDLSQQRVRVRGKKVVQHMQQSFLRNLESGRLQQCRDLRLGPEAWDAAAALSDEVDEASLPDLVTNKALVLLPTACPHLTSFSLTGLPAPGRFSFTGQELANALVQLPHLTSVTLSGQVFRAAQHTNHLVATLLRGVAAGRLQLQRLVVEHNVAVSQNTLKELWSHSSPTSTAAGSPTAVTPAAEEHLASSPAGADHQGQAGAAAAATAAGAPAMSLAPYASLMELDLSYSCSSALINLQLLQAATPQLQGLHWTGLGGFAGWRLASASAAVAASGGWRHLRVCHVGSAVRVGPTLTRHGISYVDDACLTRLLQGSPGVVDLDLSGTRVTPAGLTHLVTAVRDRFSSSSSSSSGSPADGASGGHTHPVAPASSSAAPLQQQHPPGDAAGSASAAAAAGHGSSSSVCALKRLYCSWNALGGDAGLEAVAKLFADSLQELAVNSSSSVGDGGLASLGTCKRLQRLDLSKTGVTDDGVKTILQELPDLQQLEITGCRGVDRSARGAAARSVAALKEFWHM